MKLTVKLDVYNDMAKCNNSDGVFIILPPSLNWQLIFVVFPVILYLLSFLLFQKFCLLSYSILLTDTKVESFLSKLHSSWFLSPSHYHYSAGILYIFSLLSCCSTYLTYTGGETYLSIFISFCIFFITMSFPLPSLLIQELRYIYFHWLLLFLLSFHLSTRLCLLSYFSLMKVISAHVFLTFVIFYAFNSTVWYTFLSLASFPFIYFFNT